jgi:mRNA-degrading endonuclease YafQ of YafQ-DinJ toxin-antitoxin module
MKEIYSESFKRDFKKLKREHKKLFIELQSIFIGELEEYLLEKKSVSNKFRFKEMRHSNNVWSMTWSFSRPAGRATFQLAEIENELTVIWLRIGNHDVYK